VSAPERSFRIKGAIWESFRDLDWFPSLKSHQLDRVAVKFGISNQPDKTMKLLTNLTTVALTLSIATSVAAEQLPQVPNPNVILPANVPTATQPESAPKLKKPRLLTVEQKSEFDKKVKAHDTVRAALKLEKEVKAAMALISVDTCRSTGYNGDSIDQCPLHIQAMQDFKDAHNEYIEYIESSYRVEMNFLNSINN
jgi:hypothetical protein